MASLKCTLTDAAGNNLNDHVLIDLFSVSSSNQLQASVDVVRDIQVNGIDISTGPVYRVRVTPSNHRTIQAFVSLSGSSVRKFSAALPIDPQKVVSIAAPAFDKLPPLTRAMLQRAEAPRFVDAAGAFLKGPALYSALDPYPLLKACFLNLVAKSATTLLQDGRRVLDHFLGLLRLEQDRFFIAVTAALVEETANSNAFHPVPFTMHTPLPGYKTISSFKTLDRYGNLQLTFQRRGDTGVDYVADVNIDDAQGIEHLFQVLRNSVSGPTNPYDIHDILLQQTPAVNPSYDFLFAQKAATA
jgi:hypothetical protein